MVQRELWGAKETMRIIACAHRRESGKEIGERRQKRGMKSDYTKQLDKAEKY